MAPLEPFRRYSPSKDPRKVNLVVRKASRSTVKVVKITVRTIMVIRVPRDDKNRENLTPVFTMKFFMGMELFAVLKVYGKVDVTRPMPQLNGKYRLLIIIVHYRRQVD
jgi:hypothetical protein